MRAYQLERERRFAPRQRPGATFVNAVLATAFFRCWHILVFFGAWSTLITVLNHQGHKVNFQPTLLTLYVHHISNPIFVDSSLKNGIGLVRFLVS